MLRLFALLALVLVPLRADAEDLRVRADVDDALRASVELLSGHAARLGDEAGAVLRARLSA